MLGLHRVSISPEPSSLIRSGLRDVHSLGIYYGSKITNNHWHFDAVVLEPLGWQTTDLITLQQNGTLALGYVSICEVREDHPCFSAVLAPDHLVLDGKKVRQEKWNTWVMDIRQPHWQGIVTHLIEQVLVVKGFRGLFFDTVDRMVDPFLPEGLRNELILAWVDFLRHLRILFPETIMVQNGGLGESREWTGPLLDGICWEGFPLTEARSSRVRKEMERLAHWQNQNHTRVILLVHHDLKLESRLPDYANRLNEISKKYGFLCSLGQKDYLCIGTD